MSRVWLALLLITFPAVSAQVTVGSKNFTEQLILGWLISGSLERAGIPVETRLGLGGSSIAYDALKAGEIDLYPEYTGTGIFVLHRQQLADLPREIWANSQGALDYLRERDSPELTWLCAAPANNAYALAVRREWAEQNQVRDLSELARYLGEGGQVQLAGDPEFANRPDGLPAFESGYGFQIPRANTRVVGQGSYAAAQALAGEVGGTNLAAVYATDGIIEAFDLLVLADPKQVLPTYQPAVLVRSETLAEYPGLEAALCPLFAGLDNATLAGLNAQVDLEGRTPQVVAEAYLSER